MTMCNAWRVRPWPVPVLCAAWLLAACTTHTLPPSFPEPRAPTAEQVLAALLASERPQDSAVAVGVGADGTQLHCWDLTSGKLRWTQVASPTTAPILAGEQVITQEGEQIIVRSVADGSTELALDADGVLVGADGSGRRSVFSILHGEDADSRASVVMVDSGSVRWRVALNLPAGRPALIGGYVIAPWATHRISILDIADGAERVRWFFTGTVLGHAQVRGSRVHVGQHGWIPVTQELLGLQAGDIRSLAPKPRQLPGSPTLMRDGYAPFPAPDSAEHRLRLHWEVGPSAEQPVMGDRAYLRFYRILFGLRASEDELVWVQRFEHDLVGAAQTEQGLWVADSEGVLRFVASDGSLGGQLALGTKLSMLTMRGGPSTELFAAASGEAKPMPDLKSQLTAAATLDDTRLGAARAYAVTWLAKLPGTDVTRTLVDLCVKRDSPEPVHRGACQALGDRTHDKQLVVAALKEQVGASGVRGHVGALALVASKLGLSKAVTPMLAHFDDLRTSTRDLMAIAEALEAMDARQAAPALERFVRMHHGEPEGSEILPVVTRSIETLGGLRASRSKGLLTRLAEDGLSQEPVRRAASEALQRLSAPAVDKSQAPSPEAAATPPAAEPVVDARPERLSPALVQAALEPTNGELQKCLKGAASHARIAMVVNGAGAVEGVFVTPSELQPCIEPLVRARVFPETRLGRQRVTHVVRPEAAKQAGKPGKADKPGARRRAAPRKKTRKTSK